MCINTILLGTATLNNIFLITEMLNTLLLHTGVLDYIFLNTEMLNTRVLKTKTKIVLIANIVGTAGGPFYEREKMLTLLALYSPLLFHLERYFNCLSSDFTSSKISSFF